MSMTKEFLAKMGIAIDKDEVTDEEGQTLITQHINKLNSEKKTLTDERDTNKQLVDKYSSEIADLKKEKQANMTEDEKRNAEMQELKQKVAEAERKNIINEKVSSLVELGYDKETAVKFATDELDGKSTIEYQKAFKAKVEADVKADLLKQQQDPKVDKVGDNAKYTKENFKAGKISMEEMNNLKETNPALYKELIEG